MAARISTSSLSVPSNRVEPLQPCNALSLPTRPLATFSTLKPGRTSATIAPFFQVRRRLLFQYPQTGSNLCNKPCQVAPSGLVILSVPSNRVEPLQHALHRCRSPLPSHFQYPQTGSNLCNPHMDKMPTEDFIFQYPQTGSNLCN